MEYDDDDEEEVDYSKCPECGGDIVSSVKADFCDNCDYVQNVYTGTIYG